MIGADLKAPPLADQVFAAIQGQREAEKAVDQVKGDSAHPDSLHASALRVWAQFGSAGLVGFHRRLQKIIERAAP